jgi:fructokinase
VTGAANRSRKSTALVFGEALWDLLPSGPVLGGAPLNFAYRLGSLGVPTKLVSQVGDDELGVKTLKQMELLGMDTSLVSVSKQLPTATVAVHLDENRQPSYTIVTNVAYDAVPWSEALALAAGSADILCFGTLAQRDPRSRATLHHTVDAFNGETVLVDINLRKECWSEETVRWSLEQGTIAKLNDEELLVLADLYGLPTGRPAQELAAEFRRVAGLEIIVVTLGARGAFAISDPTSGESAPAVFVPGYQVSIDDPCGAGDAFAGMFIASLVDGMPIRDAIMRANAMGALVATQPGATQQVISDDVDKLIAGGHQHDASDSGQEGRG